MAKEAYYFSHDSNARNDEKLLQLRAVYKSEGYGWYWILIEMLRDANAYRLQYDGKFSMLAISKELGCEEQTAKQFIDDCINEFALFKLEKGHFFSASLNRRMAEREEKSIKAKASALARWNANALRPQSDSNAIKENKGKEKKEKYKVFSAPIVCDVAGYFSELGLNGESEREAQKFVDHYTANGWKVGKSPMRDWKAACRNWVRNKAQWSVGNTTSKEQGSPQTKMVY